MGLPPRRQARGHSALGRRLSLAVTAASVPGPAAALSPQAGRGSGASCQPPYGCVPALGGRGRRRREADAIRAPGSPPPSPGAAPEPPSARRGAVQRGLLPGGAGSMGKGASIGRWGRQRGSRQRLLRAAGEAGVAQEEEGEGEGRTGKGRRASRRRPGWVDNTRQAQEAPPSCLKTPPPPPVREARRGPGGGKRLPPSPGRRAGGGRRGRWTAARRTILGREGRRGLRRREKQLPKPAGVVRLLFPKSRRFLASEMPRRPGRMFFGARAEAESPATTGRRRRSCPLIPGRRRMLRDSSPRTHDWGRGRAGGVYIPFSRAAGNCVLP